MFWPRLDGPTVPYHIFDMWWSMLTTLKMAGSQSSYKRKVQQDALGKVNRVMEIRRRGKDGLKINRQQHFVRKKVSRDVSVR